jgi:hypothetical protein
MGDMWNGHPHAYCDFMKHCSRAPVLVVAWLGCGAAVQSAATGADSGWVTLLDGTDPATLKNWSRVGEDNWRIEDGSVVADKRAGRDSTFLLSRKQYGDFELRAEVWLDDNGGSGIFFRGLDPYRIHARNSYDLNINDHYKDPAYGTGAIVNFAKVGTPLRAANQWNTVLITAQGTHLTVEFDGVKTVDIRDSTFPEGPVALQYNGGVVKWRKVQVKPL